MSGDLDIAVVKDADDDLTTRGGRLAMLDASETVARMLQIADLSGRFGR